MANNENLKPVRTKSEARERGRKGGIASGESRREKATLRECLDLLLTRKMGDGGRSGAEILAAGDELVGKEVSVAGRMMVKRIMGKASFCKIQDK